MVAKDNGQRAKTFWSGSQSRRGGCGEMQPGAAICAPSWTRCTRNPSLSPWSGHEHRECVLLLLLRWHLFSTEWPNTCNACQIDLGFAKDSLVPLWSLNEDELPQQRNWSPRCIVWGCYVRLILKYDNSKYVHTGEMDGFQVWNC